MNSIEDYDFYDDELDFEEEYPQQNNRTLPYRRKQKRIKDTKLKEIINYYGYAPHIGYIDENKNYTKHSKNSNCQRYIKRQTSKRARKADIPNGNGYRRVFDYWNTLY